MGTSPHPYPHFLPPSPLFASVALRRQKRCLNGQPITTVVLIDRHLRDLIVRVLYYVKGKWHRACYLCTSGNWADSRLMFTSGALLPSCPQSWTLARESTVALNAEAEAISASSFLR